MKRKRYKPKPKYKAFACYWWNPLFWFAVLLTIFQSFFMALWDWAVEVYELLKEMFTRYDFT
jgi:hypothetical protein